MKVNIRDRVRYDEENALPDDIHGTVVEPTDEDDDGAEHVRSRGDVLVEWDDGERFWEDPNSLIVIEADA
jgi:hypothetical protein